MTAATLEDGLGEVREAAARRTIPFDMAFRYDLTGEPGKVLRNSVTVSVEATFVVVSIGYGVIPKVSPVKFGFRLPGRAAVGVLPSLRAITFGDLIGALGQAVGDSAVTKIPGSTAFVLGTAGAKVAEIGPQSTEVLRNGIKLNPQFLETVLIGGGNQPLDEGILEELFQAVAAPVELIQFKYAIFDDGSGREFQSDPILNIAGLGISNGDRPFRYFARPIAFGPRSRIRMEVTEVSEFRGELHVSLQGYKVLGGMGTPTGKIRRGARRRRRS